MSLSRRQDARHHGDVSPVCISSQDILEDVRDINTSISGNDRTALMARHVDHGPSVLRDEYRYFRSSCLPCRTGLSSAVPILLFNDQFLSQGRFVENSKLDSLILMAAARDPHVRPPLRA